MPSTTLLDLSPLIIEQKRKFFEMRNQYRIFDQGGAEVGAIEQEKQSALSFLTRLGTDLDVALPSTLTLVDATHGPVLVLHKPWFTMRVTVSRPDGTVVGTVTKRIRMGKARFSLADSSGSELGEVRAENWRARDFAVFASGGGEVARVTKQWRGMVTEMFTDADSYALELTPAATEPLRSLAVAGVLAIDLVMKQKDT